MSSVFCVLFFIIPGNEDRSLPAGIARFAMFIAAVLFWFAAASNIAVLKYGRSIINLIGPV